ncbi:MAG: hypothetical protein ACRD0U_07155, partial [Acidimicrobiales bacterium]
RVARPGRRPPGGNPGGHPMTAVAPTLESWFTDRLGALWLGHADMRSTDAYIHADLSIKERALALTTPASIKPGRYKPPDPILAFLERL